MLARSLLPVRNGALVSREGGHNRLKRAAMRKQSQYLHDTCQIVLETIERGSLPAGEGRLADGASPTISETMMDTQIAVSDFAS